MESVICAECGLSYPQGDYLEHVAGPVHCRALRSIARQKGYVKASEAQGSILSDVLKERARQERLREEGKFAWSLAGGMSYFGRSARATRAVQNAAKLAVLAEEFGEVSREVTEAMIRSERPVSADSGLDFRSITMRAVRLAKLREELVQLAACCLAWCEALDEEKEGL